MLAYTGSTGLMTSSQPPIRGAIIPPTLDNAEAEPQAVPRMAVENIAGVHPYSMAHIVVALRLIPTVVALIAQGELTKMNSQQHNAVARVLRANDNRRPNRSSCRYAPNNAPGHPPIVKMIMSPIVLVKFCCGLASVFLDSKSFGRYTLNIVYASDMDHQASHTRSVVLLHSGQRTSFIRPIQALNGRRTKAGMRDLERNDPAREDTVRKLDADMIIASSSLARSSSAFDV